jgi:nitrite reductase (NADH) large subunit
LKVSGIDLFSAGDFNGTEDTEEILLRAPSLGVYKKLVIRKNRIEGAVLYGDTGDGPWYFQLMREAADIGARRENLIFGKPYAGDTDQEISPETMLKDCA